MPAISSPDMACATLILGIPGLFLSAVRIWVKSKKQRWGNDDWCIVACLVPYLITSVAALVVSWNGLGLTDEEVVAGEYDVVRCMMWWFIFITTWCFAVVPIKCSVCFTLIRIADRRKGIIWSLYVTMAAFSLVLVATSLYEYAQCTPIQFNWDQTIPGGKCLNQDIVTAFSYTLSGVNIVTDWYCAILPIPLLWNVQIERKMKVSIAFILGVGAIASISAVVRLGITANLSATSDFLKNNEMVAVLAQTEMGLGLIVANLPALRPLFSKYVLHKASTGNSAPSASASRGWNSRSHRSRGDRSYHELDTLKKGPQTSIKATKADDSSFDDANSQKNIVDSNIRIQNDIRVQHEFV